MIVEAPTARQWKEDRHRAWPTPSHPPRASLTSILLVLEVDSRINGISARLKNRIFTALRMADQQPQTYNATNSSEREEIIGTRKL